MPPLPPAKPAKPRFRIPAKWQEISVGDDAERDFDLPRALLRIDTPKPRKKPYGFWATIGLSIVIVAAAFYIGIILVQIVELLLTPNWNDPIGMIIDQVIGLHRIVTAITIGVLGFSFTLYAIHRTGLSTQEYFETTTVAPKRYLKRCIPIALYLVCMLALTYFLDETFTNPYLEQLYATCIIPSVLAILLVIVAPVFEEYFFRGFLFSGIARSRLGPRTAIVVTSILWAVSHQQYPISGILFIFILGLYLGRVRQMENSLGIPIFLHAVWNGALFIIAAIEATHGVRSHITTF